MDSHKRHKEDTTVDIHSIYDPTQQTQVIRSHRKPATFIVRPTRRKAVIALLIIAVAAPAAMAPDATPTGHADTYEVVAPEVELPAILPDFESTLAVEPSPVSTPPMPLPAREEAREAEKLAQQKTAPRRIEPKPASRKVERKAKSPAVKNTRKAPRIEVVIRYALAQQGDPYRWASAGPNSFDCSGLVLRSFKQIGIKLPHFTGAMIRYGKRVSYSNLKRGDIIFPSSGHVGIYLGNGKMVHASSGKGKVVVAKVYSFYAARRIA